MRCVVTHLAVEAVIGAIGAEGSIKTWCAGTGKLKHTVKNKTINHAKQKQLKKYIMHQQQQQQPLKLVLGFMFKL